MMSISSSISYASPTLLSKTNTSCCSCRCKRSVVIPAPSAKTASVFASPKCLRTNRRSEVTCNSSSRTPNSGDNDSRTVLDAFFLGKAFAEALNERIESTVGEILSVVGQWQAEQQKQALDFQEEVMVRAKKAKEKAASQAMEEQGDRSKSLASTSNGAPPASSPSPGRDADDPFEKLLEN